MRTIDPTVLSGIVALVLPLALHAQAVDRVEIVPAKAKMVAGGTRQFQAVVRDANGNALSNVPVVWATTPLDVSIIDTSGRISAHRPTTMTVLATAGGKVGRAELEVTERPPVRLALGSSDKPEAVVGGVVQLHATGFTELGDPLNHLTVRWRSLTPEIAEVSPTGLVRGKRPGTARVSAELGQIRAQLDVPVRANPVATIEISPLPVSVRTGDVVPLQAALKDAGGNAISGIPLRWSVAGEGAAVYDRGLFVAERPGSYVVVASVGSISATASLRAVRRADPRTVELVSRPDWPRDVEAAELWPFNDVVYVSTTRGNGTVYVFDAANPTALRLTDSLKVDARAVNDVSVSADGRIGVLTREGASSRRNGLVFFDATNARHPRIISNFTDQITGGIHSAFIYEHYVFATDNATGSLRILDFSDPKNVKHVARWSLGREDRVPEGAVGLASQLLHDVFVKDGLAYLSYWRDGLIILDVGAGIKGGSMAEPKLVSQFAYNHADLYPPDFVAGTHVAVREGKYVYIADEVVLGTTIINRREPRVTRGIMHVIDVSDIERPRKVAQYDPGECGVHNLWVEAGLAYLGAWDCGIRVLDVSGELRGELRDQGRLLGHVRTARPDGFVPNQGLVWSAIPHRGHIFATDLNTGLWVAKVSGALTP